MNYKLLTGSVKSLPKVINEYLNNDWKLYGNSFKTGNKLDISEWHYESEIAQAIIKEE
jgi:hypothetical protein